MFTAYAPDVFGDFLHASMFNCLNFLDISCIKPTFQNLFLYQKYNFKYSQQIEAAQILKFLPIVDPCDYMPDLDVKGHRQTAALFSMCRANLLFVFEY